MTTHNTHNRHTSLPPVGFEPTISAGERPKTYALDRAATGTGKYGLIIIIIIIIRDNEKRTCMLIDVAIPGDRNVIKISREDFKI